MKYYVWSLSFFTLVLEVDWNHAFKIGESFVEDANWSPEVWLCPVGHSMLLANSLEFRREGLIVIVTNAWEQMMLDLEVQTEWKIESKSGVLSKVHGVLNLTCGPALHFASCWSPCFSHARNMRDLWESYEKHTVSEQVSDPARNCGQESVHMSHISNNWDLDQNEGQSIPGKLSMTVNFNHISTSDGTLRQDFICVAGSNGGWWINKDQWNNR